MYGVSQVHRQRVPRPRRSSRALGAHRAPHCYRPVCRIAVLACVCVGCGRTPLGADGTPTDAAVQPADGPSATDGGSSDAGPGPVGDAISEGPDAPNTYQDFSAKGNWDAIDLATIAPGPAVGTQTFFGSVFAGGALYLTPLFELCIRYDTSQPFHSTTSWSSFDAAAVTGTRSVGGVTDGRYLYFAPVGSRVSRYDTMAPLANASSWSTFDSSSVNSNPSGFEGSVFDGRYAYFVPAGRPQSVVVVRFDTTASFADVTSWGTFALGEANPGASGFIGGVFDGRYVYLVPAASLVARYDTTATFSDPAAWATFDVTAVQAAAGGFNGGVFDGRYIYIVPSQAHTVVARYDTTAAFGTSASWQVVDMTSLTSSYDYPNGAGFSGGAFDGQFVYLVPSQSPFVARYDIRGSFGARTAWSFFDTVAVNATAGAFNGAGFDGQYVYFVPGQGGTVMARFRSRTVAAIPAAMHGGSFF